MSRIDTLKKQFPELDMSLIDIFQMMDPTNTNKYLQLFCKLFSKRYRDDNVVKDKISIRELGEISKIVGVDNKNLSKSQLFLIRDMLFQYYSPSQFEDIKSFVHHMEKGIIPENDVCKYSTFEDISSALSLSSLIEIEKEMESQIQKVYDDENWVVVLPLTFESSIKYGAGTKWCTTFKNEKQYFARYWNRGILAYYINKKTGYKFASFKALDGDEEGVTFWTASDNRVDSMNLNIDGYMYSIIKEILNSEKTNSEYLDKDMRIKVCNYCGVFYNESRIRLEENYYNNNLIAEGELSIVNTVTTTMQISPPITTTFDANLSNAVTFNGDLTGGFAVSNSNFIPPPEPVPNMRA
jgi:hypothetical protein